MLLKRFPNKRIVITGAGSGFGRAMAVEFAKMGWKIGIAEINSERAAETATLVSDAGGEPVEIICDVTKPEDLTAAAAEVKRLWGGVDILVNNAGVAAAGLIENTPLETWEWILTLNTKSIIYGCRAFIPLLKEQGAGYIVNMASNAGIASLPEMGCYNVTKAAAISITETLRSEMAAHNIGVSVICPTFFKTNLMDQFTSPDENQRKMANAFFSKTRFTPEQIARHVIKGIKKKKFYIITQPDAKFTWYTKRFFPELYFNGCSSILKQSYHD
ncbi:MAG: SDR family NAD(P)-dependent oxidoreductase [Thermodesulfobacteriota bacterium]|nr:SDR family NAD(P)-dependent oxidoreductase [Thermodesulfobacteriota bacterium]